MNQEITTYTPKKAVHPTGAEPKAAAAKDVAAAVATSLSSEDISAAIESLNQLMGSPSSGAPVLDDSDPNVVLPQLQQLRDQIEAMDPNARTEAMERFMTLFDRAQGSVTQANHAEIADALRNNADTFAAAKQAYEQGSADDSVLSWLLLFIELASQMNKAATSLQAMGTRMKIAQLNDSAEQVRQSAEEGWSKAGAAAATNISVTAFGSGTAIHGGRKAVNASDSQSILTEASLAREGRQIAPVNGQLTAAQSAAMAKYRDTDAAGLTALIEQHNPVVRSHQKMGDFYSLTARSMGAIGSSGASLADAQGQVQVADSQAQSQEEQAKAQMSGAQEEQSKNFRQSVLQAMEAAIAVLAQLGKMEAEMVAKIPAI